MRINQFALGSFVFVAALACIPSPVSSQLGYLAGVRLQPSTPGTADVGHANISGTMRAGQFVGDGSGLTNVAAQLSLPYSGSGSGAGPLFDITNTTGGGTVARFSGLTLLNEKAIVGPGTNFVGAARLMVGNMTQNSFDGMYVQAGAAGRPFYGYANGASASAYTYVDGADSLKFKVNVGGSDVLSITQAGRIGVRTTNPTSSLHFQATGLGPSNSAVFQSGTGSVWSPGGGSRWGIIADAASGADTVGIFGGATSTLANGTAIGVMGSAQGTIQAIGVYGAGVGSPNNYAGFFDGFLYAASSNSGVKAFLIDHPLDPENKFLAHSSVESSERMNLYRGEVVTDPKGFATVSVPNWFSALNEDIQYSLTVVDESDSLEFVAAKVVRRLDNGRFTIRTSRGGATVNWMLTGVRKDPTSQRFPLQVERDKLPHERGKYLVPEAYGMEDGYAIVPRPARLKGTDGR